VEKQNYGTSHSNTGLEAAKACSEYVHDPLLLSESYSTYSFPAQFDGNCQSLLETKTRVLEEGWMRNFEKIVRMIDHLFVWNFFRN
jgi:hypothetical protein